MQRLATVILLAGFLAGQEATFRARSPLVLIPVTVTDRSGHSVDGLEDQDFTVLDNQQRRTVHVDPAGTYNLRVSLVTAIQTSGISNASLLKIRKIGAILTSDISADGGETAVVTADRDVRLAQDFTSDDTRVRNCLDQLRPVGDKEGRVLDAARQGIDMLSSQPPDRRRILLLISESRDRGSKCTFEQVLTAAQQHNVTIYTVTYSVFLTPFTTKASELNAQSAAGPDLIGSVVELSRLGKANIGEALAKGTGGLHTGFAKLRTLEADLGKIGKDIHSQYLLTMSPAEDSNPRYHELSISLTRHPEATIRTRPGYWSLMPRQ